MSNQKHLTPTILEKQVPYIMVMTESTKEHVENKSADCEGLRDSAIREKSLRERNLASQPRMMVSVIGISIGMTALLATAGFLVFSGITTVTYTTCKVIRSDFDRSNMTCRCGIQCTAQYPCLKVYVKFTLQNGTKVQDVLLETSVKNKCSFNPPCSLDEEGLNRDILNYYYKFGKAGTTFDCFHSNRQGHLDVTREKVSPWISDILRLGWVLATIIIYVPGFVMFWTYFLRTQICRDEWDDSNGPE